MLHWHILVFCQVIVSYLLEKFISFVKYTSAKYLVQVLGFRSSLRSCNIAVMELIIQRIASFVLELLSTVASLGIGNVRHLWTVISISCI